MPARTNDGALPMLDLRSTQEYYVSICFRRLGTPLVDVLLNVLLRYPCNAPVPTLLPAVLCIRSQGELSCSPSATTADCLSPLFHAHIVNG